MKWKDFLQKINDGYILKYPENIKKSFFFETSYVSNNLNENFKYKYIETNKFNNIKQNYNPFIKKINKSKNKYVVSFYNLSKTSLLIIPYPRKNKNFISLKDFIDNASKLHQKIFWKNFVILLKKMLKKYKKIWVNTHGLGVNYFHLRLDTTPKYYTTKNLI